MELRPNSEIAGPGSTQPVHVLPLQSSDDLDQSGLSSEPLEYCLCPENEVFPTVLIINTIIKHLFKCFNNIYPFEKVP